MSSFFRPSFLGQRGKTPAFIKESFFFFKKGGSTDCPSKEMTAGNSCLRKVPSLIAPVAVNVILLGLKGFSVSRKEVWYGRKTMSLGIRYYFEILD